MLHISKANIQLFAIVRTITSGIHGGEILSLMTQYNPLRLQKKHFHSVQLIPLTYAEMLTA